MAITINPSSRWWTKTDVDPITKERALKQIHLYLELNPGSAPEVPAMALMRLLDSWEEHKAIIRALDEVLAT